MSDNNPTTAEALAAEAQEHVQNVIADAQEKAPQDPAGTAAVFSDADAPSTAPAQSAPSSDADLADASSAADAADAADDTAAEAASTPAGADGTDASTTDAPAVDPDVESAAMEAYKTRLREFIRKLKKLPGEWYIIQCYSGYENKVKTNLEMRSQTLGVDDLIHEVVVPIQEVTEIRDGKRKQVKRKLLPGYVLVRMDLEDSAWSVVRDTPGVTSFVGNEGNPTPVKPREVAKFLLPPETAAVSTDAEGSEDARPDVSSTGVATPPSLQGEQIVTDFEVGDAVTILSGPFASISASIFEIDASAGKIKAHVSILGRETPVELRFDQVEKVD